MSNFTLGVDLGQTSDYSAVVMAERVQMLQPVRDIGVEAVNVIDVFHIGTLYRWPLWTPYHQIVRDVREILYDSGHPEAHLALDATGVGADIAKLFWGARQEGKLGDRWPANYKITGGSGPDLRRNGYWMVGKIELVGVIQRYQQAGLLRISPHLELAPVIKAEMKNFQATISANGHEAMASRTGTHDDLLQALSLAMHHSLLHHRGDVCRRIPYKDPGPASVRGLAPKVFGLDPDMGPAEDFSDDDAADTEPRRELWAPSAG